MPSPVTTPRVSVSTSSAVRDLSVLDRLLAGRPDIRTNQDLINYLHGVSDGTWDGAERAGNRLGVNLNALVRNRGATLNRAGQGGAVPAPVEFPEPAGVGSSPRLAVDPAPSTAAPAPAPDRFSDRFEAPAPARPLPSAQSAGPDEPQGAALGQGAVPLSRHYSGAGPIRAVRSGRVIRAFQFDGKMAICSDGATNVTRSRAEARANPDLRYDPWHQGQTAMTFEGRPVDADRVPYVVLPPTLARATGAQKGDLVLVEHEGRRRYAIYAEVGPDSKLGEGSMFLARKLGINDDPFAGGAVGTSVRYTVLPGTGQGFGIRNGGPAVDDAAIQRFGAEAFARARELGHVR